MAFQAEYQYVSVESERILKHLQFLVIVKLRDEKVITQSFAGHIRKKILEFPDADIV